MDFQDRSIECIDCHEGFVFTAGEQEFYDRKGFKEVPKRCKPCREKRKTRRDGGGGYPATATGDDYGNRASGGRNGSAGNGSAGNYAAGGAPTGQSGPGQSGQGQSGQGQREFFDATCAACGAPARVPFRPAAGRPVYCRDCYSNRSAGY